MKKIYELKQGHGWFGGYIRETDVISCVDSGMWKWHILLVERVLADANEIIERERERVPIKDHTKMGYTMASDGDGIDLGLNRANHRGTVKHGISHTIKTECDCGVIEIERVRSM